MRLTTKGRYAVTAIMDLAIYQQSKPVVLADIATRQGIPQAYLGRLFTLLSRSGLVKSHRGPSGGYLLARPPKDISLSEILGAVNEDVRTMRCDGKTNCQKMQECLSHGVWDILGQRIREVLAGISVADAIKGASVDRVIKRQTEDWARMERAELREHNEGKATHIS